MCCPVNCARGGTSQEEVARQSHLAASDNQPVQWEPSPLPRKLAEPVQPRLNRVPRIEAREAGCQAACTEARARSTIDLCTVCVCSYVCACVHVPFGVFHFLPVALDTWPWQSRTRPSRTSRGRWGRRRWRSAWRPRWRGRSRTSRWRTGCQRRRAWANTDARVRMLRSVRGWKDRMTSLRFWKRSFPVIRPRGVTRRKRRRWCSKLENAWHNDTNKFCPL